MDYAEYWGLREKPFEERSSTRFFFESEDHREALDRLLYVVRDRNMSLGLLTGEIGSGKTTTRKVLEGTLSRHQFEVVDFENSNFSFEDILHDLLKRMAFRTPEAAARVTERGERGDTYALMATFAQALRALSNQDGRHLVVMLDEAQQMSVETLDQLRTLTNISDGPESMVTIFLVGQPELREKVRGLAQLDQRIFLRFHLNNLDHRNTVSYIQHRLRVAGLEREDIFTTLAHERIYRASQGVPRRINRLCKLALVHCFASGSDEVTREDIEAVLEGMDEAGG
jgi:general secretion pathway protein A